MTEMTDSMRKIIHTINEKRPLIHCITNIVTVNDCANILLAIGASPTMAHHPEEVEEMAARSAALVLNMGATENYEAMLRAGVAAKQVGVPVVLDPVGAAGTKYRRELTLQLIERVHPDCIRGNRSEIDALATEQGLGLGVDAKADAQLDLERIKRFSKRTEAVIVASGQTDYIVKGDEVLCAEGGSELLTKVTGAGCMASSLIGAFLAVEKGVEPVADCMKIIALCAEHAEKKTILADGGTMTFRMLFIDEVSKLVFEK